MPVGHLFEKWRNVFRSPACLLIGFCVCVCVLLELFVYLGNQSLLVALFANILSHFEGYLFILFMFFFALQKLVSLIGSHLLIFAFVFSTLVAGSKKILL